MRQRGEQNSSDLSRKKDGHSPGLGLWPLFHIQTRLGPLLDRYQFDASVLSAALGRVVRRDEVGLAVAVRNQPALRDTRLDQVIHDRLGTALGQFEVVLNFADCVAVAVDVDDHVWIGLQDRRDFIENGCVTGPDNRLVKVEMYTAEDQLHRSWWRRWRRRRRRRQGWRRLRGRRRAHVVPNQKGR